MTSYDKSLSNCGPLLRSLIRVVNPTIIEIGANDGNDSIKLISIFPMTTLHCFEPDPRAFAVLQKRRIRSKITPAFLHNVALSDLQGRAKFYQSSGSKPRIVKRDWDLSGSLNKPTGHLEYSPWVKFENEIEVETRRLDDYDFKFIDLIWMDVQGGERKVIEGGLNTLDRTRFLYTEYGHWTKPLYEGQMTREETIECLGDGWKPIGIFENCNLLLQNERLK